MKFTSDLSLDQRKQICEMLSDNKADFKAAPLTAFMKKDVVFSWG